MKLGRNAGLGASAASAQGWPSYLQHDLVLQFSRLMGDDPSELAQKRS